MDLDITIFIPCFNEEANVVGAIEKVVQTCVRTGRSYEILVFDDGSRDRTYQIAEAYRTASSRSLITIVRRERNVGLAHNFFAGARLGKGTFYRCVAGDDYELPDSHDAIMRELGNADIIIPVYVDVENKSALRLFISRLYTLLVNWVSGYKIGYYNGFPVFRRLDVISHHISASGFGFQAELLVALLNSGRSYREIRLRSTHKTVTNAFTLHNVISVAHTLFKILSLRIKRGLSRE